MKLYERLRGHIESLYTLSEIVAHLDMVFSLAYQCSISMYCRPDFNVYTTIQNGKHPILEKKSFNNSLIPNSTVSV